jgi:hypothetical protein
MLKRIFEPLFFNEIVSSQHCVNLIFRHFWKDLADKEKIKNSCHKRDMANQSMLALREMFGDKVIDRDSAFFRFKPM